MREQIYSETVDLIYLDPPLNSNANYNVLFRTPSDQAASAQVESFRDTWTWGAEAQWALDEIMRAGEASAVIIHALHSALGESDMMAYLVMMAQRLTELRRVLKSTGSIYLHCDPTASHYLKILLDSIFGARNFRSEVIWKRTGAHSAAKRWADVHDTILFYTRSAEFTWNKVYTEYDQQHLQRYKNVDADGRRWADDNLTAPGVRNGFSGAVWRGCDPTEKGNHWKVSNTAVVEIVGADAAKHLNTLDKLDILEAHGLIHWPRSGGFPRFKRVVGPGMPLQDVVADIAPLNSQARERLGYPTQKPVALLERIIRASTSENQVVLDPFCGCGTTVAAAHGLRRRWIGIDVAFHVIKVIEDRILRQSPGARFDVGGVPKDFESAQRLALKDKFQFQWWANYLVGVQALKEIKKGPDKGIDGQMYFMNGPKGWGRILTSVKGGHHVGAKDIREFKAVIDREKAEMGLFICLNEATREMKAEAATFGFSATAHGHLPRLQIVSIADWFRGSRPVLPSLGHVSREYFEPEKTPRRKKAAAPNPKAPQFTFTFPGGKDDSAVVHFNPLAVKAESQ